MSLPISVSTFLFFVLPPVLGYCAMAVLSVTPQTHTLRVALWPVIALFALRAALGVDMSLGEPDRTSLNSFVILSMLIITGRAFDWTLRREPLARPPNPTNSPRSTLANAVGLIANLRGYGREWSYGVYIPPETRPTDSGRFTLFVSLSFIVHTLICALLHTAMRSFPPMELGTPSGGSIYDNTLPLYLSCFRANVISFITTLTLYAAMQMSYDAFTLVGVLVFRQEPAQWPPAFDTPWFATSLHDFWGHRWQQFFTHTYTTCGGYPLSLILGQPGLVIGTFLMSGLAHWACVAMLNDEWELGRITFGFGMMAPGIFIESAFKRFTGRKVGGVVGWFWTMGWLCFWGGIAIDGFARCGAFGHFTFIERRYPGREIVQNVVLSFDALLHAT